MRRHLAALSVVVLLAVLALAAGCVDSSEEAAQTPATAPTVVNSAIQTDSAGQDGHRPRGHGSRPEAPRPPGGGRRRGAAGDAAAGMQVFAATCTPAT